MQNNAPFIGSISKINNTLINNAEDLDVVMSMYNLIEYSKSYRNTTGSLWNYYRDELSEDVNDNNNPNKNAINSASFKYKASITRSTYNVDARITNAEGNVDNNPAYDANKFGKKEVEIAVPLKYLSNFWRALKMPLINCEMSLILTWSREGVITSMEKRLITDARRDTSPTNATFKITDTKLYVPVVTLSSEDDNKFLEQLKSGFKGTMKWNKYRPEMTNQTKSNNSNYSIDPTFNKVNRLFVLSFENKEDRTSFSKYYTSKVQIKDFSVSTDEKGFFDVPVKNKEEAFEKIIEISKNNDYTTGNLLGYEYFSKHCKLIVIDLSKQIELENPDLKQQINFIGKLEDDRAITFFIIEKSEETAFEFSQNSVSII